MVVLAAFPLSNAAHPGGPRAPAPGMSGGHRASPLVLVSPAPGTGDPAWQRRGRALVTAAPAALSKEESDEIGLAHDDTNDYRFGNVLRFDIGGQLRAYPSRYERYDQLTLNMILEVNGQHAGRDTLAGDRVGDSGGVKLCILPHSFGPSSAVPLRGWE